jgi:hypothetical protein
VAAVRYAKSERSQASEAGRLSNRSCTCQRHTVRCSGMCIVHLIHLHFNQFTDVRQNRALELPKEHEMPARDKYTVFNKLSKGYRKGIHKVPKWTRVRLFTLTLPISSLSNPFYLTLQLTLRTNPKGF